MPNGPMLIVSKCAKPECHGNQPPEQRSPFPGRHPGAADDDEQHDQVGHKEADQDGHEDEEPVEGVTRTARLSLLTGENPQ